jgi:hypothetical protein
LLRIGLAEGTTLAGENSGPPYVIARTRETAIDRFIRQKNVEHYRLLLDTTTNETARQRILGLLAEERQKQKDAGDPVSQ